MKNEPKFVEDVYGPCPDCENGLCQMNCGSSSVSWRVIIAAAVLEIEDAESKGKKIRQHTFRMLKRFHPEILRSVQKKLKERQAIKAESGFGE